MWNRAMLSGNTPIFCLAGMIWMMLRPSSPHDPSTRSYPHLSVVAHRLAHKLSTIGAIIGHVRRKKHNGQSPAELETGRRKAKAYALPRMRFTLVPQVGQTPLPERR